MIEASFRNNDYPGTEQKRLHFHVAYELLFVVRGWVDVQISDQCRRATAPSLVFFGNLEEHRIKAVSSDYARYVLTIAPEQLRGISPTLLSIFNSRPADFHHVLSVDSCSMRLPELFDALVRESGLEDACAQFCAESLVHLLLAGLYRRYPEAFPAERCIYPKGIIEAQRFLDEHFQENLSMDEVARMFFLSPGYFRHLFVRLIGFSPKQYVMRNRLARARELLENTTMSVSQIAEQVGFSDASNFIRSFKAHYGATPSSIRKEKSEKAVFTYF